MNLLLKLAQIYIPDFYKKKKLNELFELTAQAFLCLVPDTKNLSYRDCLKAYALFTQKKTENVLNNGTDTAGIKERLYRNAYQLGEQLGKKFHIKTQKDVLTICKILYKILGIEFQGDKSGKIKIRRCYFSGFYTDQVCGIISSLDEGVIAGLAGGGKLTLHNRITEGKECCLASFEFREKF
ncbi:hypothetical protein JXQ31_13425 [candidate division KSB1 bacterium]|nr:hypothetical protein [candidate division KSB1 bacterium]